MKKALIKVGYTCNNNCIFCHSRPFREVPDLSTEEIKARIGLAKGLGAEMVVLSGGEPTIRKDVVELARWAQTQGLKTGFITNGRRLAYPDFAAGLAAGGLEFVYLSFYSHQREAHALVARTDSLPQTLCALENLVKLKVDVTVNTVVTRYNIGELPAIVDILAALRPGKIKFSVLEPKGAVLDNLGICPPLTAAAKAITGALRYGQAKYPDLRFGCEGLTPCLAADFEFFNDDLIANDFILFREAFEKRFCVPDYANCAKAKTCLDCVRMDQCPGIFSKYLEMRQAPLLQPEARPRSNSFVFLKKGKNFPLPRRAQSCPVRFAAGRRIFLARAGRMRAYEASPADFSSWEVEEVLRLGQVYATANGKHENLNHGRDLIKLRVASICAACERKLSCPRIYELSRRKVFAPLEADLERIVRRLKGEVLDVGCGTVRFRNIVETRVRMGKLRYVGIDPKLAKIRTLKGMRLVRTDIETFQAPEATFDHVLVLRSYNHIQRPSVAFPKIHRMLKHGGRLIVVDGLAYGLVLSRQPKNAKPGEFQHFRNHASRQARVLLEAFGFRTVSETPVHPAGCNEWLLVLRKK